MGIRNYTIAIATALAATASLFALSAQAEREADAVVA